MTLVLTEVPEHGGRSLRLRCAIALVAGLVGLLAGCASLPSLEGRTSSSALTDTSQTLLGSRIGGDAAAHPGKTGVHALPEPHDAFAARVVLAGLAEKSIDAQYYIWHGDQVGYLMFEALWRAAERGVRVRLLLDDANTKGLDQVIATLDAHPNIEVRLYNPLTMRNARLLNFVVDFERVNHRMHNKSFTVDNQVTIVGGRNIANEYFGASADVTLTDLDVIATGDAVREVSKEFDLYWNSASAYPAPGFVGVPGPTGVADLEARFTANRADPQSAAYLDAVRATPLLDNIVARTVSIEWTSAQVLYDDPAKTLEDQREELLLFPKLRQSFGDIQKTFDLVSPYFIPGEDGTAGLVALANRGVKLRILTNSLASAEVAAVQAGYSKRREDLLRAGIELYELKPDAGAPRGHEKQPGPSVGTGLHAKTYAIDGAKIFVGSFNFDPRSGRLNTEMGLVIDSSALAQRLAQAFDTTIPHRSWQVRLGTDGTGLEWVERTDAGEKVYTTEPETSWWRRFRAGFMAVMPIEWLL